MAKTWLHALVTLCALVTIAAVVQSNAPDAKTFASAVKSLMAKPSVQPGR